VNTELVNYIEEAREKNLSDEQIKDHLLEIGWPKEKIIEAIAHASGLPIPPAPPSSGPILWWIGVSYLLLFVVLSMLAVAVAGVLHNWIDKPLLTALAPNSTGISASFYDFFADYYGYGMTTLIQFYVPTIIISYFIALGLSIFLKRETHTHPSLKETRFYKILFFAALVIAFIFTFSEMITAGYGYLSGNTLSITFRHVVVSILASGIIFIYLATGIKHFAGKVNTDLLAFVYITFFAVIALIYAFRIIPSASTERAITNDHKRIIDIGQLTDNISTYYQNNSQLPPNLNVLTSNIDSSTTPLVKIDPETFQPYQYTITGPGTYKICADFSTASSKDDPSGYDDATGDYANFKAQFTHPVGYHCFDENENNNGVSTSIPPATCLGGGCPDASPVPTYPSETPGTPTPFPGGNL